MSLWKVCNLCDCVVPLALQSAPRNTTVLEGEEATFTCTMDGTDILNATWFSPSGMPLEASSNVVITNDITPTGVVSTLRITNIQWPSDHGLYTFQCVAQNGSTIDTVQTTVHLHIQGNRIMFPVISTYRT